MAAVARKSLQVIDRPVEFHQQIALASDDAVGIESPAIALQQLVEQAYSTDYPEPHVEKWPSPIRLLLLFGLTVSTWTLVIMTGRAVLHA